MWIPNRSDTNQSVQSQKQARSMKFWIYQVEELYYPCSENKGADQLRGYREADLRLCFRLCRLLVFPWGGSNVVRGGLLSRLYLFFIWSYYLLASNNLILTQFKDPADATDLSLRMTSELIELVSRNWPRGYKT